MKILIIGRGKNGWYADGHERGNKCSSSGGSLENYLKEAEDGTCIYDAEDADYRTFADWVLKGPMLNTLLLPHEIDSFKDNDKKTLFGMLPALEGAFKGLAVIALTDLGSLDYVGLDVYLTGMRARVKGVKFGKVLNHKVVWE